MTPAPVSSSIASRPRCPQSTNALPSVGCPANGSSVAGVKIRIRASPPAAGGSTNTVSDRFISLATRCILSGDSPPASVNTASGLPSSGVPVNTSTIRYDCIEEKLYCYISMFKPSGAC